MSLRTILIFVVILAAPQLLFAKYLFAEYKIATIDMKRVLNTTNEAKAAKDALDSEAKTIKEDIDQRRAALQQKGEALQAKKIDPQSSEAQSLKKEAQEFASHVKSSEMNMRKKYAASNAKITERAMAIVKDYAVKNEIDLVLEKSEIGRSAVLYGKQSVDITEAVISKIKG